MAEVFVGEALSVQGFRKRVAIKRVLPHLAQNTNFIGMFLDEARLGARLNHANIVSVFDIGAADDTYFIVMEFVDGANLKKLMESVRAQGRHFPMKEAIYIAMEACRGLSYAHDLHDDDGNLLLLVHRDVSPPNILISKRGEVKVTDFGLAKATTQLETTDPGVVKGKFAYLCPEAARGEEVDLRADIFAMGIVLWELLSGRRLFLGENDYQTIKLVRQSNVPSLSRLNPEVDTEFEQVLGRALEKDPNDRYQSAREFSDALAGYLFSHQMKVTAFDIANLVKVAAVDEPAKTKSAQQQSIIDKLIQEEMLRFTSIDESDEGSAAGAANGQSGTQLTAAFDGGSFENPATWFDYDDIGTTGTSPVPGSGRWQESGQEALPMEELAAKAPGQPGVQAQPAAVAAAGAAAGSPATASSSPAASRAAAGAASGAPAVAPPSPGSTGGEEKKSSGGGAGKLLLVALVLIAGAGVAAYLGGVFQ